MEILYRRTSSSSVVFNRIFQHILLRVEKLLPLLDYSNHPSSSIVWDLSHYSYLLLQFFSSKYLLPSHQIVLPSDFLESIAASIYSSHLRPAHRQTEFLNLHQSHASLIPNLNLIHRPPPVTSPRCMRSPRISTTITVEFKVKSGLLSISPFLSSYHLKRSFTKFHFMQFVKFTNKARSPIQSFHISQYNPNDLSSQNYRKIRESFSLLEDSPQNNFLISLDGQRVFGFNELDEDRLDITIHSFFKQVYSESVAPKGYSKNLLYDIMASILSTECALVELQLLQASDLLDIEGMIEVFYRLVHLISISENFSEYSQSEKFALEKIASTCDPLPMEICRLIAQQRQMLNNLLLSSSTKECTSQIYLHHLENLINILQQDSYLLYSSHVLVRLYKLSLQIGSSISSLSSQDMEEQRQYQCSSFLQSLNLDDCIFLLKLWLLSLAAADSSAILTIGGISSIKEESQPQTHQYSGIYSRNEITDPFPCFSLLYHLILVDLGPKPVDKILEKIRNNEKTNQDAEKGWKIYSEETRP